MTIDERIAKRKADGWSRLEGAQMTQPTRPNVVHVYREYDADGWRLAFGRPPEDMPKSVTQHREYLGEYVPAPGPVVAERWEVRSPHLSPRTFVSHDDARGHAKYQRCSGLSARIVHIVTRRKAK